MIEESVYMVLRTLDNLRGQYFDGVIIDEVGDQNPRIWNEIVRSFCR